MDETHSNRLETLDSIRGLASLKAVKETMANRQLSYKFLPCIFVGWDNTARRGRNGIIIKNQNKDDFKASLIWAKNIVTDNSPEEQIIFINAWNEWVEGNHLEPDAKFRHQFLEAVKEVFDAK